MLRRSKKSVREQDGNIYSFSFFFNLIRKLSANFLFLQLCLVDALGCRGSGSMRGAIFEEFFFKDLPGSVMVLKRHECNDEKVELMMVSLALDEITIRDIGSFVPPKNCCYFTPHMQNVDIILNVENAIFLIQCSILK